MEAVRSYLTALFTVAVCAGVVLLLCPESKGEGMRRTVKYVCGLCVTLCLVFPILRTGDFSFPELTDGAQESGKEEANALRFAEIRACQEIALYAKDTYALDLLHVDVTIEHTDLQALYLTDVHLTFDQTVPTEVQNQVTQDIRNRYVMAGKEETSDERKADLAETARREGASASDGGSGGGTASDFLGRFGG